VNPNVDGYGEVVQPLGNGPYVCLLIGSHAWKSWEPPSLTPLLLHIFNESCWTCFNQNYVLQHTHNI